MNTKTCMITGGNSGIGKAAAIQIAQKGDHVIIGCRNEKQDSGIFGLQPGCQEH